MIYMKFVYNSLTDIEDMSLWKSSRWQWIDHSHINTSKAKNLTHDLPSSHENFKLNTRKHSCCYTTKIHRIPILTDFILQNVNCLLTVTFIIRCWSLQTLWNQIRTDRTSGLIWIQDVWLLFWKYILKMVTLKNTVCSKMHDNRTIAFFIETGK